VVTWLDADLVSKLHLNPHPLSVAAHCLIGLDADLTPNYHRHR